MFPCELKRNLYTARAFTGPVPVFPNFHFVLRNFMDRPHVLFNTVDNNPSLLLGDDIY